MMDIDLLVKWIKQEKAKIREDYSGNPDMERNQYSNLITTIIEALEGKKDFNIHLEIYDKRPMSEEQYGISVNEIKEMSHWGGGKDR